MPIDNILERAKRAALLLSIAAVMWFSHLDMAEAVAAQTYMPTQDAIAAQTTRDRDLRVRALAARLEVIAADLARIQPVGEPKPSAAEVQVGRGDAEPNALALRVLAEVDALGDFEAAIEADWQAENDEMAASGVAGEIVARQTGLLDDVHGRAAAFRALITPLRDARDRGAVGEVSASLANMSDFFAQQTRARAWAAIDKAALPLAFTRTEDAAAPREPAPGEGLAPDAVGDPPGPGELAETLDAPFTPAIRALAQSLGGQPVAIRNWVYDNIEFHPSWGSVQGADQTLLSRRGNAFDIASLTLAMLRASGVPTRYAKSVVEVPIDKAQNWLGNLATPQMAVELMQKGGVPAAAVVAGGRIVAVRFEHVWVEAWVDFIPSRAAINRAPDQWVPFDVAFKQFDYVAAYPWRENTLEARRTIARDFIDGIRIDTTGGITGFDFDRVNTSMGRTAQQLADEMIAADPNATTEQFQDRRSIRPIDSLILAGALPYPLRSATIARYAEVPAALRQTAEIRYYADESALRYDSPSAEIRVPLVRLGTRRFGVDYAPATTADAQALAQYAASNAASLPLGQINVIPRLMLGDEVLWQSGSTRMGTMHYWHVDVRDASGHRTTSEAYRFAAGSSIALVPDLVGVTPDRVEREGAGLPDVALLPTRDALYYGGLLYWAMSDHLRDQAARSVQGTVLRMPSIGAFASPYQVAYFFGVPRTGFIGGRITDIKVSRLGIVIPRTEDNERLALHLGAAGSMPEGATWSLLSGNEHQGLGMSAATALKRAIDDGQRIFQITRDNLDVALGQLQLSSFAENEIAQSVNAGLVVVAHEREVRQGTWSGSGYVVFDPSSGSSLQRIEGGYAGGIEVGCIILAVSLSLLCQTKLLAKARAFLLQLGARLGARILALSAVAALLGPIAPFAGVLLGAIAAVITAVSIAYAVYEVVMWVRGIIDGWETLTPEELTELGINGINDIACSYLPPCLAEFTGLAGGFGDDERNLDDYPGLREKGSDSRGAGRPLLGNPVAVGTGTKWQTEVDYEGDGAFPLRFVRSYASAVPNIGSFVGVKWSATYFQSVRLPPSIDGSPFPTDRRPNAVAVMRADGGWAQYDWRSTAYVTDANMPGRLERLTSGETTTGWLHHTPQDTIERYNAQGRLQSITNRAGLAHTLSYDSQGRLSRVTHTFGRTLDFAYDADSGYLATVTDPAQRPISFTHDVVGNLTSVRYADTMRRLYHYEDLTQRFHLTGITDERGVRYVTWRYDHKGRALSSEKAGGVERYAFRYEENRTFVTDPLGTTRTYEFATIFSRKYLKKVTEPCGSCGSGNVAETTYDSRGLIASEKDFEGRETRYTRNARSLIETLTEAPGTPLARVTRIAWHPSWHLPTQVLQPIEGGTRTTDFAYDAEGNLQSRTVSARGDTRTTTTMFDADGQLTGTDGPRTDVTDTVAWTYDASTGNRATTTDAAGHAIRYPEYDADGRLLERIDANDHITEYRYDERGRLTRTIDKDSPSDPGETTRIVYTPSGNVERLTLADASFLAYTYDAADRLTHIEDSLGRRVTYTLNALGQRTREETFDANDTLVTLVNRRIDGLGRIEAEYGSDETEAVTTTYDATGNEHTITDALDHVTTHAYDGLNRLSTTDLLHPADPDYARIVYGYDAQDNLTSVSDPRQRVTQYVYNGFDELADLLSPDTGTTSHRYDPAGNLHVRTDARGQRTASDHDALNRLVETRIGPALAGSPTALANVEETLSFFYDEPTGGEGAKGRLTSLSDGAAMTHLVYDRQGRRLEREQALGDGVGELVKTWQQRYDSAGRIDQTTLPSGAVIGYSYGVDGRVLTITINGVTIVLDVEYQPFGDVKAWTQGATGSSRYQRSIDTDGRIAAHGVGDATREFAYDAAHRITGILDTANPGSGIPATPASPNWTFDYDGQDRIASAANSATLGIHANLNLDWTYDATGNRTSETRNGTPTAYTIAPASNRLDAIGTTSRSYDGAGNTASDGTYAYTYSARNRLVEARLQSSNSIVARYRTNAFGERVCKATAGGQCPQGPGAGPPHAGSGSFTQFVYDESGHLLGEYDQTGSLVAEHVWLDDTPIAVLKPSSYAASHGGTPAGNVAVFHIEPDHLDTPRVILNATHQTVWRWNSTPFGDTPAEESPTGLPSFTYALRFPGQYHDPETNSHYNYFRDYEPGTGRYLQSDPIGLAGGFTTFQYTLTGPLIQSDQFGLASRTRQRGDCKVIGTPQKTGPGHWFSSARWALCQIDAGATTIWFHSAMKTICGGGTDLRKPDAAARFPNDDLWLCESCSGKGKKRQSVASQEEKMRSMRRDNGLPDGNDTVIP